MNVAAILSAKGNTVEVVAPRHTVTVAVHRMATRGIGSLVVVGPDDQLIGVVGERDIVRGDGPPRRALPRAARARHREHQRGDVHRHRRPRRGDAPDDRRPARGTCPCSRAPRSSA